MEDPEKILMDLNVFEKNPVSPIPQSLEDYLDHISKTGNTVFPWPKIKPLFKIKLETTISEFNETLPCEPGVTKMPNVESFKYTEMKERMMEQLESYSGVPFTVQRLCELLTQPSRHYKRVDKFMRGLEKVMLVVTTIEPGTGANSSSPTNPATSSTTQQAERNGGTAPTSPLLPASLGQLSPVLNGGVHDALPSEGSSCSSCPGSSRLEHSPSKRMRLDSEEEETSPSKPLQPVSPGSSGSVDTSGGEGEAAMEIDAECTSSQARPNTHQQAEDVADAVDDSLDKPVDSGDVSTSVMCGDSSGVDVGVTNESEMESAEAGISDSSDVVNVSSNEDREGEAVIEDGCSSSEDTASNSDVKDEIEVNPSSEAEVTEQCEAESSAGPVEGAVTVTDVEDRVSDQVDSSDAAESSTAVVENNEGADSSDAAALPNTATVPVAAALEPLDEILPAEAESLENMEVTEQPSSCAKDSNTEAVSSSGTDSQESEPVESSPTISSAATVPDQSDDLASSTPE